MAGAGEGGEILTRPLLFEGRQLRLNYATSAVGSVRVQLQQASGEAFPGFGLGDMEPVYGDRLDDPVSWTPNREVFGSARLRIRLLDADVFALRFALPKDRSA